MKTKKQRIEIYEQAIRDYSNRENAVFYFTDGTREYGFCDYFERRGMVDFIINNDLPELISLKPKHDHLYWWRHNYSAIRLKKLKTALVLCEKATE